MANIFTKIENAAESVGTWIGKEVGLIPGLATTVVSDVDLAANIANNLVNSLKAYVVSPAGQVLVSVIEAVPGIGPYVGDVLNFLPKIVTDLGWATTEFTKSPEQVVIDGVTEAVSNSNVAVKASNLLTLAGHILSAVTASQQAPVPVPTAITIAAATYAQATPIAAAV